MVTIVKHEWHQTDRRFCIELDEDLLSEIYPDLSEDEISELLVRIETGHQDVDEVINDAFENDVEIEWDFQYDDCWTDRKGGYDVTYELGDEDSWHTPNPEPEPTHKCTKCRWKGHKYETNTLYLNEDGSIYEEDDLEFHSTKDVCPMCDSDIEFTEEGTKRDEAMKKLMAELDDEMNDE